MTNRPPDRLRIGSLFTGYGGLTMGVPAGWVTDVPGLTRNDHLTLLGNGVVPQQAEHAVRLLLDGGAL